MEEHLKNSREGHKKIISALDEESTKKELESRLNQDIDNLKNMHLEVVNKLIDHSIQSSNNFTKRTEDLNRLLDEFRNASRLFTESALDENILKFFIDYIDRGSKIFVNSKLDIYQDSDQNSDDKNIINHKRSHFRSNSSPNTLCLNNLELDKITKRSAEEETKNISLVQDEIEKNQKLISNIILSKAKTEIFKFPNSIGNSLENADEAIKTYSRPISIIRKCNKECLHHITKKYIIGVDEDITIFLISNLTYDPLDLYLITNGKIEYLFCSKNERYFIAGNRNNSWLFEIESNKIILKTIFPGCITKVSFTINYLYCIITFGQINNSIYQLSDCSLICGNLDEGRINDIFSSVNN